MLTMFKRLFLVVLPMLAALTMLSPMSHASETNSSQTQSSSAQREITQLAGADFLATSKKW